MREGGLDKPTRHPLDWQDPSFVDPVRLDEELRRVFDICHGCRRCFNLCDSFPRLFDLVDQSTAGEVEGVASSDFKQVVDACTLCDMCYMVKCPYVPPHPFNIDFPHLMLRYRYTAFRESKYSQTQMELAKTDRNGVVGTMFSSAVNYVSQSKPLRQITEKVTGIDQHVTLPTFTKKTLVNEAKAQMIDVNQKAPAFGQEKVVIYATCFHNYNDTQLGLVTRNLLAKAGIMSDIVYPQCCGMPMLEQGNLEKVSNAAVHISKQMRSWVEKGYKILSLVPSCSLMLKQEWPLLLPSNEDIKLLADHTYDVTEYIVWLCKEGLFDLSLIKPLKKKISVHIACHSRAQNMGQKAAELLRYIPSLETDVIERCSGHGGTWGIMKNHFETALKVGKPVAKKVMDSESPIFVSECPLAAKHIQQNLQITYPDQAENIPEKKHPLQIFASACGVND